MTETFFSATFYWRSRKEWYHQLLLQNWTNRFCRIATGPKCWLSGVRSNVWNRRWKSWIRVKTVVPSSHANGAFANRKIRPNRRRSIFACAARTNCQKWVKKSGRIAEVRRLLVSARMTKDRYGRWDGKLLHASVVTRRRQPKRKVRSNLPGVLGSFVVYRTRIHREAKVNDL